MKYSKKQSKRWLSWLAQRMSQENSSIFLIEQMQPTWLPTNLQIWLYPLGVRLIIGLIVSLIAVLHFGTQVTNDLSEQSLLLIPTIICGLLASFSSLIIPGMLSGLLFVITDAPMIYLYPLVKADQLKTLLSTLMIDGIVLGIFLSLIRSEIGIIDTIQISWSKARKYSVIGLLLGLTYVLARLLFSDSYGCMLLRDWNGCLKNIHELKYFKILIELLIFTLLPGLIGLFDGVDISKTKVTSNEGIWIAVRSSFTFFVIFFPVGMLCGWKYSEVPHEIVSIGLAVGLLAGLAGGRGPVFAGLVLIQHFVLRVILWWQGYIPWNYAQFLDYATKRGLLRKVGGGYIFWHRMLLEHFAQMYAETERN